METAKAYWIYSQRLRHASSDASRRLMIDHEILPAAHAETNEKKRNLLLMLVSRHQAAA